MEQPSRDDAPAAAARKLKYLSFALGDELFAMDIAAVREIIQARPMTSIPLMPAFARGVINLRGSVVPVIDLNSRFGRGETAVGKKTCIIIFQSASGEETAELGLMVDAVRAVVELDPSAIEPAPNFGAAVRREFISGMGRIGDRFVVLVDCSKALDLDEVARLCETAHEELTA